MSRGRRGVNFLRRGSAHQQEGLCSVFEWLEIPVLKGEEGSRVSASDLRIFDSAARGVR
jgi:hypothetical protein